ncbi:MAG: isopentenyl phosphate kinase [Pseudomonadota bacterium]
MARTVIDAVVKLGGSVVTDKGSDELRVRTEVVRRLAEEIAGASLDRLVLVHGAGSYGHRIVQRTGIDRGTQVPSALVAWAETQRLQYLLAAEVAAIFIGVGVPAIPLQASASARLRAGVLEKMDLEVARHILEQGGVPMFYGVPAIDTEQGCAILSGDQIAPYAATGLGIDTLVYATDVDGVYEGVPKNGSTRPIPHIHRGNWEHVAARLGGSTHVDVTGGMAGKIAALLQATRKGVRARIVDANVDGRVAEALAGGDVGTLVSWEKRA